MDTKDTRMTNTEKQDPEKQDPEKQESHPFHVRLPGFIVEEQVGLGNVIKRVTYAMGFKSCAGCEKRAAMWNRWIVFRR